MPPMAKTSETETTSKSTANPAGDPHQPIDIFWWANQADGRKQSLEVELFLFNKHYTPYSIRLHRTLNSQLKPLFLYDYINEVTLGAGTGLVVRDYEQSEAEDNVLLRTRLDRVGRAETLLHLIEHERHDIVEFDEAEHDLKRIKGILARWSDPADPAKTFYTIKALQPAGILKGAAAWELRQGQLAAFQAEAGLKLPADNQVLIVGQDIFIFAAKKFERLFQYEYKKQLLADQRVAEIEARYRLSFPDGVDLQSLVRDRKKLVNKLQKLELGDISQEQALAYADEMALELMTDDSGAIIILDGNDLDTFVNLINEDYITSQITGRRYEIKSKKLLDDPQGEPPRG